MFWKRASNLRTRKTAPQPAVRLGRTSVARRNRRLLGALLAAVCCCAACRRQVQAPTVSGPARRIVTISPGADEILCAIGAAERVVGVSAFTTYPPELAARPRVGGLFDPDLEAIVSLDPDLIVVRGHNATLEDFAARRGIRLYRDPTEGLDDLRRCIRDLGALTGLESDADAVLASLDARLEAARRRAEDRRAGRAPPRVLMTLARNPSELKELLTAGAGTTHDEILRRVGAENIFGDLELPYPTVSLEQVVVRAPDIIIELMPEVRVTPGLQSMIAAQWAPLACPAVASGRIFVLGDDLPHSLVPSLRTPEIADRITELLWPSQPHP
ncbi:MAG: Vitamin B12-binding protein [Phycisphaerae bacterium]|nr:Vitamin B12-binding protein [Phycisphaerae bacterium]